MPIVKAKDPQRVNMRREQIERFLASSSTVSEWCALNKVSESTFYKWMAYFREVEPDKAEQARERASEAILDVDRDVLDDEMANNERRRAPSRAPGALRGGCV